MSPIVRAWIAFAAVGTGIIHLALVIGAPLPLAAAFGALGFVEFAWGVLAFAREPVAPRIAIAVALAPILAWAVLITVAAGGDLPELEQSLNLVPLAVATLFEQFVVAVLGANVRRDATAPATPAEDARPPTPGTAKYLVGVVVGAFVVAALTAPALAVTDAGLGATPHGGIPALDDDHENGDLPGH